MEDYVVFMLRYGGRILDDIKDQFDNNKENLVFFDKNGKKSVRIQKDSESIEICEDGDIRIKTGIKASPLWKDVIAEERTEKKNNVRRTHNKAYDNAFHHKPNFSADIGVSKSLANSPVSHSLQKDIKPKRVRFDIQDL
ncbi:unnamed protein product [Blepharisma stoltei]|uniref:Uncharacterized protein n=1 Tax=Blepharisma stoltei TaxID=1481888 RepID=A0AAU9ITR5_9CILI|nr:unnamed protein product [Blepharisma stoltei]